MNIFTANQVNQVYVLKPKGAGSSHVESNILSASYKIPGEGVLAQAGAIGLGKTADGKSIYFKHIGVGGVTRSDLININNIISIKATPASKMARTLSAVKITINSAAEDGSSHPIAGKDFILRLKFQNPVGMSPDNQYWKYGVAHSGASMSKSDFYKTLALSIVGNMSRESVKLVSVFLTTASDPVEVTSTKQTLSGAYTGIIIKEVEQDWILGVKQQKPTIFTVEADSIDTTSGAVVWADILYNTGKKVTGGLEPKFETADSGLPTAGTIVNSKLMADFEYFYMGERGDQYRMTTFPNFIPTTYLVDPAYPYGYDTISIHYAYTGANHSVQKSEKDITILIPADASANASGLADDTDTLMGVLNTAIAPAMDSRYIAAGEATTAGYIPVFDSNGALTASTKKPGDIS